MSRSGTKHVTGVVLAAGYGSRFPGTRKQLLPINGKPLLQHVIDNAFDANLNELVIVLGHAAEDILAAIEPGGAKIVLNPAYASGQSSSLIAAVRSVAEDADGVLVLLGDQPGITPEIINVIVGRFRRGSTLLVIPRYQGRRGNPVLFDRSRFPEILKLTGDEGARQIFAKHPDETAFVDFDFPAPLDIDTPEDFESVIDALHSEPAGDPSGKS